MINAYKEYWSNMTLMNATATRAQYWWPQLINYLVLVLYSVLTRAYRYIDFMSDGTNIVKEWNLVTVVFTALTLFIWLANFTVRARRLHDRNHSNWWILFYLIPIVGSIVLFVTLLLPSKQETQWVNNQSKY
ncbi:DUF805 domain-containing protein [Vagococcus carniphilus]|uniref:DUF805 domain-containing protein n=1 Tax=Vagococcus carniphilus TaxID=218144 RepID=UPI003B59621B